MKTLTLTSALAAWLAGTDAFAAINIPSDGSDGALVVTQNTVIDLSQAVTGAWDANNTANASKGIYDPEKWAVVFKYSSVTVNGGATVTFKNHPSRAPVVWLVQGDVTINGTVSLNGQQGLSGPSLATPGPGGFRGGTGYYAAGVGDAGGFGPGGGNRNAGDWNGPAGGAGSYGSVGVGGLAPYGNPSLVPLIGGSGGAGTYFGGAGGGGGGGAILVACAGHLSIAGALRANGARGALMHSDRDYWGSGGSGGGVRLVAESISGGGVVEAIGGDSRSGLNGGLGRIRVERSSYTGSLQLTPDPSVVTLPGGSTPQLWLPGNGPTVRIVSIGGETAPADPRAEFGAAGADVVLPRSASTTVVVETTNVEQASMVTVRAMPRSNGNVTQTPASVSQVVSEDPLVVRWTANVPVQDGYGAIQVKVVRP